MTKLIPDQNSENIYDPLPLANVIDLYFIHVPKIYSLYFSNLDICKKNASLTAFLNTSRNTFIYYTILTLAFYYVSDLGFAVYSDVLSKVIKPGFWIKILKFCPQQLLFSWLKKPLSSNWHLNSMVIKVQQASWVQQGNLLCKGYNDFYLIKHSTELKSKEWKKTEWYKLAF